jgi:hypothetical protein
MKTEGCQGERKGCGGVGGLRWKYIRESFRCRWVGVKRAGLAHNLLVHALTRVAGGREEVCWLLIPWEA